MPEPAPSRHSVPLDLEGVDAASQGAVLALMRTMKLQRQLMQKLLARAGDQEARPGQAMCLRVLAANDGIAQRDLADKLQLARPTVTLMLQRMERRGFVRRSVDPDDQRLTRVHLTPAGRHLAEHQREVFAEHIAQTFGRLPEADRRELERLLTALSENASQALVDADAEGATVEDPGGGPDR